MAAAAPPSKRGGLSGGAAAPVALRCLGAALAVLFAFHLYHAHDHSSLAFGAASRAEQDHRQHLPESRPTGARGEQHARAPTEPQELVIVPPPSAAEKGERTEPRGGKAPPGEPPLRQPFPKVSAQGGTSITQVAPPIKQPLVLPLDRDGAKGITAGAAVAGAQASSAELPAAATSADGAVLQQATGVGHLEGEREHNRGQGQATAPWEAPRALARAPAGGGTRVAVPVGGLSEVSTVSGLQEAAGPGIALESSVGPPSGVFKGPFIATKELAPGKPLMFPRKKLRDKLTHYSIGKASAALLSQLPNEDFLRARGRTGSCAVVGNGGSTLLYELGALIDSHDLVIRLNSGPTSGFEKHVGNKTGVRLVNRAHIGYRERPTEPVLQHVSTDVALRQFMRMKKKDASAQAATYMIDMQFHEHAYQYTDKGVLSNGLYAILLASELCTRVTIFGFLRQWKGSARYHYYNQEEPDTLQSQRDDKEERRIRLFLEERAATHRYGEPCMTGAMTSLCGGGDPCPGGACPAGTACRCGVWHPVPLPGFCYGGEHPLGAGAPDVGCIRRCPDVGDCPGGVEGFCPPHVVAEAPDRDTRTCANLADLPNKRA